MTTELPGLTQNERPRILLPQEIIDHIVDSYVALELHSLLESDHGTTSSSEEARRRSARTAVYKLALVNTNTAHTICKSLTAQTKDLKTDIEQTHASLKSGIHYLEKRELNKH